MTTFATRDVDVITLPLGKVTPLHPERCVIKVGNRSFDLGAFCYIRRSSRARAGNCKPLPVDQDSFVATRREPLRRLIEQFSLQCKSSGLRSVTIATNVHYVVKFANWCDQTDHAGLFGTVENARQAFRDYVTHLRHRVRTNDLQLPSAWPPQTAVARVLNEFFGIDDITIGVHLIRAPSASTVATEIPDEKSQAKVLSLCECIFNGFGAHVRQYNPYPFKLKLPNYLGWNENALWIFPIKKYFKAPHEQRDALRGYWAYDYQNGRIAALNEVVGRYRHSRNARYRIKNATKQITRANQDRRDQSRIGLAMVAHNAFVLLFLAYTGMNWAVARAQPWARGFTVGRSRQGFKAIKYRAKGKKTSFEIQSTFLPVFRCFLALREYLLNGRRCNTLFVSFGPNMKGRPKEIGNQTMINFFKTLRRIDPSLPKILARQWRAAKGDWFVRTEDPQTTADLLGNSLPTTLQSYAAGSPTRAIDEMSDFFRTLTQRVLKPNKTGRFKESALGGCKNYGAPHATDTSPPIPPDCKQSEGCLFCDQYVVHADERDIRKLMSCRTVLYRTAHFSQSEEHFQALFGEVLKRIRALLDAIAATSKKTAKLIPRIQKEVEDHGLFDPYWEGKLQMLIDLGAVSA